MSDTDGPELSPTAPQSLEEAQVLLKLNQRGTPPVQMDRTPREILRMRQEEAALRQKIREETAKAVHDRAHLPPLEPTHISPVARLPHTPSTPTPQNEPVGPLARIQTTLGSLMAGGVTPERSNT